MNYIVKALIVAPKPGLFSEMALVLHCFFTYSESQYGNGYYCKIYSSDSDERVIDLRYDDSFDANNKEQWLRDWVCKNWSGENGSWKLQEVYIKKV